MYTYVKLGDIGQLTVDFRNLLWSYVQTARARAMLVLWLVGLRKCGRLDEPDAKNLCLPKLCKLVDTTQSGWTSKRRYRRCIEFLIFETSDRAVCTQLRTRLDASWRSLRVITWVKRQKQKEGAGFQGSKTPFHRGSLLRWKKYFKTHRQQKPTKDGSVLHSEKQRADSCSKPQISVGRANREYCLSHNARALATSCIANPACAEF